MADILHRLNMDAPPTEVFRALTEEGLLRGWGAGLVMREVEREEGAKVAWRCVEGPPDWIGTDITFLLAREGKATVLRFAHRNWRDSTDAMAECATQWARVLLGLKSWLETPEPDDVLV